MPRIIVKTMSVEETVDIMRQAGIRCSSDRIRFGIQQGIYPWGECVQMQNAPSTIVYSKLFFKWLEERGEKVEEVEE